MLEDSFFLSSTQMIFFFLHWAEWKRGGQFSNLYCFCACLFMRLIFLYLDYLYLIRFLAILQRFSFVTCKTKEHRIHICNIIIYRASESQESNVNRNKLSLSNQQQHKIEKKSNWSCFGGGAGVIFAIIFCLCNNISFTLLWGPPHSVPLKEDTSRIEQDFLLSQVKLDLFSIFHNNKAA